jgi:hypothetical protein
MIDHIILAECDTHGEVYAKFLYKNRYLLYVLINNIPATLGPSRAKQEGRLLSVLTHQ